MEDIVFFCWPLAQVELKIMVDLPSSDGGVEVLIPFLFLHKTQLSGPLLMRAPAEERNTDFKLLHIICTYILI